MKSDAPLARARRTTHQQHSHTCLTLRCQEIVAFGCGREFGKKQTEVTPASCSLPLYRDMLTPPPIRAQRPILVIYFHGLYRLQYPDKNTDTLRAFSKDHHIRYNAETRSSISTIRYFFSSELPKGDHSRISTSNVHVLKLIKYSSAVIHWNSSFWSHTA